MGGKTTRAGNENLSALTGWGGLFFAIAMLAFLLSACSTARQRDSPTGVGSLIRFRDPEIRDYLRHVFRSGNLYLDYRSALTVDAIVEDQRYRDLYIRTLKEQFLLTKEAVGQLRAEQEKQFENQVDILVFIYEGTNIASPLHKKNAIWKLYLRDDDGQLLTPASITKIKPKDPVFLYLQKYFDGLDRWSGLYRIRFPKLSKTRLGQSIGKNPFELILTGIRGTVTLKWKDPKIFYRSPKTKG